MESRFSAPGQGGANVARREQRGGQMGGERFGRILGVGGYRPRRVVGNQDVAHLIDRSEEWIESRSGIRARHYADAEETLALMGSEAAAKALAGTGVDPRAVDCVIVSTTTNLVSLPPVSVQVMYRIGASNAGAFDLSAACAGFCYALGAADHMIRCAAANYVLVVGSERLTDLIDPHDDQVAFLLADGAGAVLVGPSDQPGIGPVVWGADGDQLDAVVMTRSWADLRHDRTADPPVMRMHGRSLFRWVVSEMVPVSRRALAAAQVGPNQLRAFIPHQANMRITDLLAVQLGLPPSVRIARDIVNTGNTSSASIPLAMEALLATGEARTGDLALLVGFGAGLTFAAQVVSLP